MALSLKADGFVHLPQDGRVARWAAAARGIADRMDLSERRHGQTWFVGVDALPNDADGSIDGVPLRGAWDHLVPMPEAWHPAQLSVVYPGYPMRDPEESDAAHRFRKWRDAAHLDGLLPEGPKKRRHLREPHAFVLGLPLSDVTDSPLVVWKGSHLVMRRALRRALAHVPPSQMGEIDLTDVYQKARRAVFA